MLMLSNSFQEIISFVISSHQIITYREEVYSEHCQTFKRSIVQKESFLSAVAKSDIFRAEEGEGGGGGVHGTMALQ